MAAALYCFKSTDRVGFFVPHKNVDRVGGCSELGTSIMLLQATLSLYFSVSYYQ